MAQLARNLALVADHPVPWVDHQVPSVALARDQTKVKEKERTREKLALNRRDERSNQQNHSNSWHVTFAELLPSN